MNKRPLTAAALEKVLAERLVRLLGEVPWLGDVRVLRNPADYDRAFDLLASFKVPRGPVVELWVDIRSEPRPSHFPYVAMQREFDHGTTQRVKVRVFAAPHISPRLAELCESHGWSWFDLSGNCHLRIPGLIHIHHTGNPPVHATPKPDANLGTTETARVVRALLASELLTRKIWTQRGLWSRCEPGVSLGLVNKVVRHLREERFLAGSNDRGFQVADPLGLLQAWRNSYGLNLHHQTGYFTLLNGRKLLASLSTVFTGSRGKLVYAGFSAASIQAPHVREPKTWVYVSDNELPAFEKILQAKPVDSGANLMVLIPSDDGVFAYPDGGLIEDYPIACTNPVQTYVDLWHCGGRGQEAAEALLEQRLKPAWRAAGYQI
jgi:hypothetical protein